MPLPSPSAARQSCARARTASDGVHSAGLRHAAPKGLYVAPVPDEPLVWTGVLFVRKGRQAGIASPAPLLPEGSTSDLTM